MAKYRELLLCLMSAVAGGFIVIGYLKASPQFAERFVDRSEVQIPEESDSANFFSNFGVDPFKEIERIQKQFGQQFQIRTLKHTGGDIETREDQEFVYFDVKVSDPKSTEIHTRVEEDFLTITGETKTHQGDDESWMKSSFSSTFSRTVPLPGNIDPEKMQMEQVDDKIVIKFPKVNS